MIYKLGFRHFGDIVVVPILINEITKFILSIILVPAFQFTLDSRHCIIKQMSKTTMKVQSKLNALTELRYQILRAQA